MTRPRPRSRLHPRGRLSTSAGLHHGNDVDPGIRRVRRGKGFRYVAPDGRPVGDGPTLDRIRSLVVPPAWTDVWISADPLAHVQATGRDARGRKQSRYHPRWRAVRDETKFERMIAFGHALPRLRRQVQRDLAGGGPLSRRRVVATVVRLLEETLVRVGNDEYARDNGSYGLTTLRDGHVRVRGPDVTFRFTGKGGKVHDLSVSDRRLAGVVRRCQDLPGQRLFQCVGSDGKHRSVGSSDVNAYLRRATGQDFTAKDFRTWAGTVLALTHLGRSPRPRDAAARRHAVIAAVDAVAACLRNTRAVCRSSYVHPAVLRAGDDGSLWSHVVRCAREARCPRGLRREEAVALRFLERGVTRRGDGSRTRAAPAT